MSVLTRGADLGRSSRINSLVRGQLLNLVLCDGVKQFVLSLLQRNSFPAPNPREILPKTLKMLVGCRARFPNSL
jgi:hypothetical protein